MKVCNNILSPQPVTNKWQLIYDTLSFVQTKEKETRLLRFLKNIFKAFQVLLK